MEDIIKDYKNIIDDYLENKKNAQDFVSFYHSYYLDDGRDFGEKLYDILDGFFAVCDGYTEVTELHKLNPDFYINEEQLRAAAKETLDELRKFASQDRPYNKAD